MTVNKLNKWCQDCPHSTCETCDITWTDIEELKKDIKDNYISKDKIREQIEQLENKREQLGIFKSGIYSSGIYKISLIIAAYKKLLEEE